MMIMKKRIVLCLIIRCIYQVLVIRNKIMKRLSTQLNSNLPSLQGNLKHSQSRESVKVIESKIHQHESEITRNQKVIISLTNDFRLLKDELHGKIKDNQQINTMYAKAIEENQRFAKINKELRQAVLKLQKTLEEKQKQKERKIGNSKGEDSDKMRKMQQEIVELKTQATRTSKVTKVLQTNNHQLIKENQKLKQDINNQKKVLLQKNKMIQADLEGKSSALNRMIRDLRDEVDEKNKQIKDLDDELFKMKNYANEKEKIIKNLGKYQKGYVQAKEKFQRVSQENKLRKQRNEELEKELKDLKQNSFANADMAKRVSSYEESERTMMKKIELLQKQKEKLKTENRQLAIEREKNKKKMDKLHKMIKTKPQLLKVIETIDQSIKCDFCSKILQKPVTSIPCGHSFCFECKRGYEKECKKCVGVKRQAVYRNQLLDQLISGYKMMVAISDHMTILQ